MAKPRISTAWDRATQTALTWEAETQEHQPENNNALLHKL